MSVEDRLQELGITLPEPPAAAANYVPYVIFGNLVTVAGQVPFAEDGSLIQGKVGVDVTPDEANQAARICGLQIIAQLKAACDGNLDRVRRIIRIGGFVNCIDGFPDQPEIINGASDLLVEVFGDKGRHSRAAVGCNSLPRNVPVEVEAMAEIEI